MLENDSTKPINPRRARHSDLDPEGTVERPRKRSRKPVTKKQHLIAFGKWQKISVAAIILCLILIGSIIFILTRDTTSPVIQKVSFSDMTAASATITWQTNRPATSQVTICNSDGCVSTELDESLVNDHSTTLTDIKPNTKYQLTIISRDKHESEARLALELITQPKHYEVPLAISEIKISDTSASSVTVSWKTDRPATSQIEYGENDTYSLVTPPDNELTTNHSMSLFDLKPGTIYHLRVKSEDGGGNAAMSESQTHITLSAAVAAVEVGPEIGKRAPDFTLLTLDGKEVSLSQFRGKVVLLNFWATSCPACDEETPYIQAVFDNWPHDQLEIITVSIGERAAFVRSFVESRGLTFPTLLDSDETVSQIYQVSYFPTTFFINADGIIKEIKTERFKSQSEIENILKSL
jgi:peroxiredoxin